MLKHVYGWISSNIDGGIFVVPDLAQVLKYLMDTAFCRDHPCYTCNSSGVFQMPHSYPLTSGVHPRSVCSHWTRRTTKKF